MAEALIDRVVNDIAAGRAIDWPTVLAACANADERAQLEGLQRVERMTRFLASPGGEVASTTSVADIPRSDLAPGDRWGRYRILDELGSGTYGCVYRAYDDDLQQEIAIKILHQHVEDAVLRERLLKEGRALAKIHHPHVVRVLNVEFQGDRLALCMEFISGDTLEHEVRERGTFSQHEVLATATSVCAALAAVHHAKLLHRDVKARNIVRERNTGRIVLMDFGTGRDIGEELESSRVAIEGTALYMAPEVLLGQQPASETSDVYSVGVLMYYLLTGAYPVEASTIGELRDAHRTGRRTRLVERRPDLPHAFAHAIERAIAPERRHRPENAVALLATLEDARSRASAVWVRRCGVAAAAVLLITALGLVNTFYFNAALGRLDFVNEGPLDWIVWGARAMLPPVVISLVVVLVITVLVECKRLTTRLSQTARAIERVALAWIHRRSLDDVTVLSSVSLLLSTVFLVSAWWYFAPLIGALFSIYPDISTVHADRIGLLSPDFAEYHLLYQKVLLAVALGCVVVWYPAIALIRRRHQSPPRSAVTGGVAVLAVTLLLLDFPYRLLSHDIDFAQVTWNEHACYQLAERADQRLLFCPDLGTPRNRVVPAAQVHTLVTEGDAAPADFYEIKKQRSIFTFVSEAVGNR